MDLLFHLDLCMYSTDEKRMLRVHVWLDKQNIFSYQYSDEINTINVIDKNLPRQGQVVKITREGQKPPDDCAPLITICEVQVWGKLVEACTSNKIVTPGEI